MYNLFKIYKYTQNCVITTLSAYPWDKIMSCCTKKVKTKLMRENCPIEPNVSNWLEISE